MAAREGHTSTLEVLVAAGADVNIKNEHGKTPAYLAYENYENYGHKSTLEFLVLARADCSQSS